MARPIKQTVDYFPHYCDSSKTIPILESRFGNDGYAFWFKILELLAKTEGHFYDCNNPNYWEFLLAKTRVNDDTANAILGILASLGKIDKSLWGDRVVWCQNLINNLAPVYTRRETGIPLNPRYDKQKRKVIVVTVSRNPIIPDVSPNGNRQSKVKYSKEDIYSIFDLWNSVGIIQHRKLTDEIQRAIEIRLKELTQKEICQSIKNYAEIVKDEQYYFEFKWTLKDFLRRGAGKFVDIEIARQNYKSNNTSLGKRGASEAKGRGRAYEHTS